MSSEKVLARWTDPLGRKIAVSAGGWNGHVLRRHPDMAFRMEDVGKTLQDPEVIRQERMEWLYYREIPDDRGNRYVKVVVRFEPNAYQTDGFVATAYAMRVKEEKGTVKWRKS